MRTAVAAVMSAVFLAVIASPDVLAGPPAASAAIYAADIRGILHRIDPNRQEEVASLRVKGYPYSLWSYDGRLLVWDGDANLPPTIFDPATGATRQLNAPKRSSENCVYVINETLLLGTLDPPAWSRSTLPPDARWPGCPSRREACPVRWPSRLTVGSMSPTARSACCASLT